MWCKEGAPLLYIEQKIMKGRLTMTTKRKPIAAITAVTAAAAILLGGTFAWQSISQTAKNEVMATVNPGGRLHDDFDGRNKDVYVENFTDEATGGQPIFARVRLDEYMEIGIGAGLKTNDEGYGEKNAKSLVDESNINDVNTWKTHIPDAADDPFHAYWNWTTGGSTIYMPTFNKNKDSLKADINGTYEGTKPNDDVHYDDYNNYFAGQVGLWDAIYDADINDIDEGDDAVEDVNITTVQEEHTAKATIDGTVMTMQKWMDTGSKPGPYWVWDTDGWAYWAQPILPGEATGLLLDGIDLKSVLSDSWYYSINVVGQFVTADNIGGEESKNGFFDDKAGTKPSKDALELLKKAIENKRVTSITVSAEDNADSVKTGEKLGFSVTVEGYNLEDIDKGIVWSIDGNSSDDTDISNTGVMTVAADETANSLTITATSVFDTSKTASVTIAVKGPLAEIIDTINEITPGTLDIQ